MLPVEWKKEAIKELDKIDFLIAQRIVKKVNWLSKNFDDYTPETLHGTLKGTYKLRVGNYRIIYTVSQNKIIILSVGHRSEVYKA